ncbi:3-methyl-2-oxobutanoate hydroxymethyltransferase [Deferribacter desulfuricans SSM1]|uniref:3-methyl-2-oxobutanoate hydroxymethyltransferase n=1 Tax=Deferribacter desulfuricans (strain DSM 14783 / JCM 11476 / NBRC 101012 / SSM1) TaxID=639282 RepID=D3PCJ6_DEFDS|nr:3-methyl-2-oxobutanoate hydroxymethyltransferase [Deferribacter desulfuricans]BAI80319.1 3-methyl-2-oxobutanoate hydroxymethyltransferase [Deferribacter desulfuricans SSM1]
MSKYCEVKKITVNHLKKMKKDGEKIACLTAYDYTSAKLVDAAGVDLVLVGDSLGMVINGYENTLYVTLDEIIYHTKAVKRGLKRAFLVADMPFGTYHISEEEAIKNCVRVIKESGAEAVKLEGGKNVASLIKKLVDRGINVMGHIGLMPQYVHSMGGYKIQGREGDERLIEDALALEEAGVFAIVLEGVVAEVSKKITETVKVPTIGIGAGKDCDGQILVFHDVFGMFDDFVPKFVKRYADVKSVILDGGKKYIEEVKNGIFPSKEHSFFRG